MPGKKHKPFDFNAASGESVLPMQSVVPFLNAGHLWGSLAVMAALLVIFSVLSISRLWSIEKKIGEEADAVQRRASVIRNIELGVTEYVSSVRGVLGNRSERRTPDEVAVEIEQHFSKFETLAENTHHHELAAQFAALWRALVAQSQSMIGDHRAGRAVDREPFRVLQNDLKMFLVDNMARESFEHFDVVRAAAIRDLRDIFTFSIVSKSGFVAIVAVLGITLIPYVRRIETALRKNERQFRNLIESVPVGLVLVDSDDRIVLTNARSETIFGYSREELLGQPVELVLPERSRKEHARRHRDYFAAPQPVSLGMDRNLLCLTKGGTELPVEIGLVPIQTDAGMHVLAAILDISERKRDIDALRKSEERFARAQQAAAVGTWDWDMKSNQSTWTDQTWRLFGREPGAFPITYQNWLSCIHPNDRNDAIAAAKKAQDVGTYSDEMRIVAADGTVRWVETRGEYIYDEARRPVRMIGTVHDITERKQADADLARTRAKLSAVIENTQDAVWSIDNEMRLIFGNTAFRSLYKSVVGTEPVIGQSLTERLSTASLKDLGEQFQTLWKRSLAGEHCQDVFCLPFWERPRFLEISFNPIRSGDTVTGVVTDSRDITEYKVTAEALSRARDELEQQVAERTANLQEANERLSVMAGGISHELNQPLTAIANYAEGCLRRLRAEADESGELRRALTRIVKEVHRSGELIRHLRDLTARTSLDRQPNSINDAVRETLAIVESISGGIEAKVNCRLSDRLPTTSFDRLLITQVLLNLIRNGMDATTQMEASRRELTIETVESEDGCLQVNVQDNGVGLSDEAMKYLFAPFRSTKSGGMGLGLVISKDIVELHGGRLWATQLVGSGASFHFKLPISS